MTVFSWHTKVQLRIHRAWIAEFFVFILSLPVNVLNGFHRKWYEMKGGTFNLPGARLSADWEPSSLVSLLLHSSECSTPNPSNR